MRAETALELREYASRKEHDVGTTNQSNKLELSYMCSSISIISSELDLSNQIRYQKISPGRILQY